MEVRMKSVLVCTKGITLIFLAEECTEQSHVYNINRILEGVMASCITYSENTIYSDASTVTLFRNPIKNRVFSKSDYKVTVLHDNGLYAQSFISRHSQTVTNLKSDFLKLKQYAKEG